ncbi:magnesium transporter [Ferrimonas marina]|uniref:Magnesium transporter n=1 Tax=Ferrimonas marina TaxID=299255 RepID=A0A1M5Z4G2_9GAMM|nr:magnesium transporter [Ferrimonas marina]SHI19135.1 magnesium transporter [Ferrimonas marina]
MSESSVSSASPSPYRQLQKQIRQGEMAGLPELIRATSPSHVGRLLRSLSEEEAVGFWRLMACSEIELATDLLDHLADLRIAAILSQLPATLAADLVLRMESDDRRDVIGLLAFDVREAVLAALPQPLVASLRLALRYEPGSAGNLLKTEMLSFASQAKVADVVRTLRASTEQIEHFEQRYVYLHDEEHQYAGAVAMRELLLADQDQQLQSLVDDAIPTVDPAMPLDELKSVFDHLRYSVFPLVDVSGRQIGVVDHKDLQEALYEQAERELLEQGGILGGEEFRTMGLGSRILRRLAFLLPSVALSYAAVSVIALYEPVLDQLVVLAAFLPLVANLCGAVGNQAVAVSIRELSVDRLSPNKLGFVVAKEIPVGVVVGLVIGTLLAGLASLRSDEGLVLLPLVIGLAYSVSSILAVAIGGVLPLLLKRLGLDPAMLASPLLTTLTDAVAFFFVLFLAQGLLL